MNPKHVHTTLKHIAKGSTLKSSKISCPLKRPNNPRQYLDLPLYGQETIVYYKFIF